MIVWIATAAALLLNTLLVVLGRGTFINAVLAVAFPVYVGAPALVVAFIAFMLRRRYASAGTVARISAAIGCVAVSALASLPVGAAVASHDIRDAETYCESFIPQIQAYKRTHGEYPRQLSLAAIRRARPRLIRDRLFYSSDTSAFYFSFEDPRGLLNTMEYSSKTAQWVEGR